MISKGLMMITIEEKSKGIIMISVNYNLPESIETSINILENDRASEAYEKLVSGDMELSGWVNYPFDFLNLDEITSVAKDIQSRCDTLVVIGVGGSYLGAQAALEFINKAEDSGTYPKIVFAGWNLSAAYHQKLINEIKDDDICICIISKSGKTIEPCFAFEIFKNLLNEKYSPDEVKGRIYAITDPKSGILRAEADANAWATLPVPSDVGGRYSFLTPVGLLPALVAGINIEELISGAKWAKVHGLEAAKKLATVRVAIESTDKCVEVLSAFEPSVAYFIEWLRQLYGESEGKCGRGLLPVPNIFTRDLHSVGQFLQEGKQCFSETILTIKNPGTDIKISDKASKSKRSMNELNEIATKSVIAAHSSIGIPILNIEVENQSAKSFGALIYFFETVSALTGIMLGVNPFDQPGVEAYKHEMDILLKN
jgi:glucose-6-phosphate isomerase